MATNMWSILNTKRTWCTKLHFEQRLNLNRKFSQTTLTTKVYYALTKKFTHNMKIHFQKLCQTEEECKNCYKMSL